MFSRGFYLLALIALVFLMLYWCYLAKFQESITNGAFTFIILSYIYKLFQLNKCPKCGKFMRKSFKNSFYLPDFEKCDYDGTERTIRYRGQDNI